MALSAAAVVAGASKASEADPRRGKPSKPRPGEKADPHNDQDEVATKLSRPCDEVDFGSIIGPKGKGPQTNGPKLGRAPNIGPERGPRPGPARGGGPGQGQGRAVCLGPLPLAGPRPPLRANVWGPA